MHESLTETVALVTGSSSGIGRATAIRLAKAGATVVLAARRSDQLQILEKEITGLGASAFSAPGDISVAEDATRIVAETVRRFERLDILVNAAGVMLNGPSVESPLEEWD